MGMCPGMGISHLCYEDTVRMSSSMFLFLGSIVLVNQGEMKITKKIKKKKG